jgi:DNA (cytosine-5)-methyltransferase 3A
VIKLNILSLFDGMACGVLAMQKAGVKVDTYTAYEIDKYAIQTATHNFPMIKECGDVFSADFTQYKDIDYIIGGSPCTYWSIAQKNNRETEASGLGWELFSQYVRALNDVKPKFFIYENNKSMSSAIRESITKTFGFEPICINSALVSAQNRNRLYWVGKRNDDGTYSKVDIKQPEDYGIFLKDILDNGCDLTVNDKSWTLTASYNGAVPWNMIERCQRNMVAEPVTDAIRVGSLPRPNGELSTSQAMRIYSTEGKSVNLVSGGGGMGGKTGLYAVPVEFKDNIPTKAVSYADDKTYTVYEVKNGLIAIKGKEYPIKLNDGYYIIRKLTVSECKRLQTVPEWYEFPVSDTQAYKMLGNGWTVDVIAHLIKATLNT